MNYCVENFNVTNWSLYPLIFFELIVSTVTGFRVELISIPFDTKANHNKGAPPTFLTSFVSFFVNGYIQVF